MTGELGTMPGMATCPQCQTEFTPQRRSAKQPPQRYCSRPCANRASAPLRAEKNRRLPDKVCESCGKTFHPANAQIRFCSRQCYYDTCGHRYLAAGGYYRIKVPKGTPGADGSGRMLEHRYVMQESLGRPLRKDEHVHHIDGDRGNNAPENLQLVRSGHGKGQAFVCRSCGSHDVVAVRR